MNRRHKHAERNKCVSCARGLEIFPCVSSTCDIGFALTALPKYLAHIAFPVIYEPLCSVGMHLNYYENCAGCVFINSKAIIHIHSGILQVEAPPVEAGLICMSCTSVFVSVQEYFLQT